MNMRLDELLDYLTMDTIMIIMDDLVDCERNYPDDKTACRLARNEIRKYVSNTDFDQFELERFKDKWHIS